MEDGGGSCNDKTSEKSQPARTGAAEGAQHQGTRLSRTSPSPRGPPVVRKVVHSLSRLFTRSPSSATAAAAAAAATSESASRPTGGCGDSSPSASRRSKGSVEDRRCNSVKSGLEVEGKVCKRTCSSPVVCAADGGDQQPSAEAPASSPVADQLLRNSSVGTDDVPHALSCGEVEEAMDGHEELVRGKTLRQAASVVPRSITTPTAADAQSSVTPGELSSSLSREDSVQCGAFQESFVFTWGENASFQLVHEEDDDPNDAEDWRPRRIQRLARRRIAAVSCGTETTWVSSEQGDVWAGGYNDQGQICADTDEKYVRKLRHLEVFDTRNVRCVAGGRDHSVAVLESGAALSFGTNEFGQLSRGPDETSLNPSGPKAMVGLAGIPVSQASCGTSHTVILTKTGQVFSCGDGSQGCMASPDDSLSSSTVLIPIADLFGIPVLQVAAGAQHTMALTVSGAVYTWGRNKDGQLGHQDAEGIVVPRPRQVMGIPRAKYISGGTSHSAVVVTGGRVFTAGSNTDGQLGRETDATHKSKEFLEVPIQERVNLVSCGSKHSVFLLTTGVLLGCGRNAEGQLGHDKSWATITHPIEIPIPSTGSDHCIGAAVSLPKSLQPEILADVPFNRTQSEVRPLKLTRTVSSAALGGVSSSKNLNRLMSVVKVVYKAGQHGPQYLQQHFLAGMTVEEGMTLLARVRVATDGLRQLKTRLSAVYSDVHRLNCSFLLPGRIAQLDVEGVEEFYEKLFALPQSELEEVKQDIANGVANCLESADPYAHKLTSNDQVRFLLIVLHCPIFASNDPKPRSLMSKLLSVMFKMPQPGREALKNLMRDDYPSSTFSSRLLNHVKMFVNFQLENHSSQYRFLERVWHGVVLLQLLYLANLERSHTRRVDEAAKRDFKVPLTDFCVDAIESIDAGAELALFQEFLRQRRASASGTRDTSATCAAEAAAVSESAEQQGEASSRAASSSGDVVMEGADRTSAAVGSTATAWNVAADSSTNNIPGVFKAGVADTTRAPGWVDTKYLLFSPQDALTVSGVESGWCFFMAHLNICPLKFKRKVIVVEATFRQHHFGVQSLLRQAIPFFVLQVRRSSLVEDALAQITATDPRNLLKPLKVVFIGEEGLDEGGLKREFFSIVTRTLFDLNYGMFVYKEVSRTLWLNKNSLESAAQFFLIGCLIGLAIYNDIILDLSFPLAIYKKLLGQDATALEDLAEVDPDQANGFRKMLDMEDPEEFEAAFGDMTFQIFYDYYGETRSHSLLAGGENMQLTMENRDQYVKLYTEYILRDSVLSQFQLFERGFLHCQSDLLRCLTAEELQVLVVGTPNLNFNELRQGARYAGGYSASDQYIEDFWDILLNFELQQRKNFLMFCTGCSRVPISGLKDLQLLVQKNGFEPTDRLPTAYTCYNCLLLPEYESKAKLRRLLVIAIEQSEGFGLQ